MAHRFEKGGHLFFLFRNGFTVQDSQLKPRYYLSKEKAEQYLPYGDEIIEYVPAAEVVEVVRCENCEYYNRDCMSPGTGWCEYLERGEYDKHFCNYGDRRKRRE